MTLDQARKILNFIIKCKKEKSLNDDIVWALANKFNVEKVDFEELGLFIYRELRGCSKELAKEEWTAQHTNNSCKTKASWLAKVIAKELNAKDNSTRP